jgi:hypothetical protein
MYDFSFFPAIFREIFKSHSTLLVCADDDDGMSAAFGPAREEES